MIDFNIEHYLDAEEKTDFEHTEDWHDQFYGDLKDKPETEQKLFEFQKKYRETRDPNVWSEMFELCYVYMRSLVLKRQKGKCFVEPEEISSKTATATLSFMSQYLKNPSFEVGASFAGMMSWKIVEALYGQEDDKCWSLNSPINTEGDELLEVINEDNLIFQNNKHPDEFINKIDTKKIVDEVLDEADKVIDYDPRMSMLMRVYILLYFRKPRSRHAKKFFISKLTKDNKEADFLERVILEIYNRIKEEQTDTPVYY